MLRKYISRIKKSSSFLAIFLVLSLLLSHNISLSSNASSYTSIGLKDETAYYILNAGNNQLIMPMSSNQNDYCDVSLYTPVWTIRAQWLLDKQSDGSYKFHSFAGNGKTLASYGIGSILDVNDDANYNFFKFEISRVNTGAHQGQYLIMNGDYYVTFDQQYREVTLTRDIRTTSYWSFMAVNKRDAEFFCFDINNMHTSTHMNTFRSYFNSYGYSAYIQYDFEYPEYVTEYLTQDDIFIFAGYGAEASIDYFDSNGHLIGTITADEATGQGRFFEYYVNDLALDSMCLSRCVIYLGSHTGTTHNGYNLVDITYDKGAHYVLGVQEQINESEINTWLQFFFTAINNGFNIESAVNDANFETNIETYSRGDGSQFLKF